MAKNLIILPEAELDITEAYDWYQERELGLGEEFLRCIDASIQTIKRNPEIYVFAHEKYRRALVRRFPYAIFTNTLRTQ
jgi:plasmid stabilization system protein ParE